MPPVSDYTEAPFSDIPLPSVEQHPPPPPMSLQHNSIDTTRGERRLKPAATHLLDPEAYLEGDVHQDALRQPVDAQVPRSMTGGKLPLRSKLAGIWNRHKGVFLVLASQFFGTIMNVLARLLEAESVHGPAMHPFQILLARMAGTFSLSLIYEWWGRIEHAPFGPREVWALLVTRGIAGFFGVFGMYYSLLYLSLADATVIVFLAPVVTCWACSIMFKEIFPRSEQIAGIISFLGVILIARPTSFLPHATGSSSSSASNSTKDAVPSSADKAASSALEPTPSQRLQAVGVALVGVVGASVAFTSIRAIGHRAHPLISITHYAFFTGVISLVCVFTIPGIPLKLPGGLVQWTYLVALGICGFVTQYLITAGLAHEHKSNRATNMLYTQMLYALAFDKLLWGITPSLLSVSGSGLILSSAIFVAVRKSTADRPFPSTLHDDSLDAIRLQPASGNTSLSSSALPSSTTMMSAAAAPRTVMGLARSSAGSRKFSIAKAKLSGIAREQEAQEEAVGLMTTALDEDDEDEQQERSDI